MRGQVGPGLAVGSGRGWARFGPAGLGVARLSWLGKARLGKAGHGMAWHGCPGGAWLVRVWRGTAWRVMAVKARTGAAWLGGARPGAAVPVWPGGFWRREARLVPAVWACHGEAGRGKAMRGWARLARQGKERLGPARYGVVLFFFKGLELHMKKKNAAKKAAPRKKSESKKKESPKIIIPSLDTETVLLTLVGVSPLICHRFGAAPKEALDEKKRGKATSGRKVTVPEDEFLDSLYVIGRKKYGFPCSAFKNAAVSACSSLKGLLTQTLARQSHHVLGTYVEIKGDKPKMREDTVRVPPRTGGADLRYRGEFTKWSVTLEINYNRRVITLEQLVNLHNLAGYAVGVGEWRPEKSGSFGMYKVK